MSGHTPGPWVAKFDGREKWLIVGDNGDAEVCQDRGWGDDFESEDFANARLIAAAPELLAEVEREYIELADPANQWPGRHTAQSQARLCRLRDLICAATGREPQDVQDDYGNRALAARLGGAA